MATIEELAAPPVTSAKPRRSIEYLARTPRMSIEQLASATKPVATPTVTPAAPATALPGKFDDIDINSIHGMAGADRPAGSIDPNIVAPSAKLSTPPPPGRPLERQLDDAKETLQHAVVQGIPHAGQSIEDLWARTSRVPGLSAIVPPHPANLFAPGATDAQMSNQNPSQNPSVPALAPAGVVDRALPPTEGEQRGELLSGIARAGGEMAPMTGLGPAALPAIGAATIGQDVKHRADEGMSNTAALATGAATGAAKTGLLALGPVGKWLAGAPAEAHGVISRLLENYLVGAGQSGVDTAADAATGKPVDVKQSLANANTSGLTQAGIGEGIHLAGRVAAHPETVPQPAAPTDQSEVRTASESPPVVQSPQTQVGASPEPVLPEKQSVSSGENLPKPIETPQPEIPTLPAPQQPKARYTIEDLHAAMRDLETRQPKGGAPDPVAAETPLKDAPPAPGNASAQASVETPLDITKLSYKEVKELARARGVGGYTNRFTKAQLIEKLGGPKAEPPKAINDSDPASITLRRKQLQDQLRTQIAQEGITDLPSNLPLALDAHRGDKPYGSLVSLERATAEAERMPADHPSQITLHNLRELEKGSRGAKIEAINTNDVQDGTRVQYNSKETVTIDKENGEVADGIRAPIPEGGITLFGKKLPPSESSNADEPFVPPEAQTFSDLSQKGVFGQPVITSSGVGDQQGMFHEPVNIETPREKPVGSAEANKPENTPPLFENKSPRLRGGRHAGAVALPDELIDRIGEMKPVERAKDITRSIRDFVSIDSIPALHRANAADEAVQHASARVAVPHMVNDLLAKVFPEKYHDADAMSKTIDILNKDNILAGYDSFLSRAAEAEKAGDEKAKERFSAAARAINAKHDVKALAREVQGAKSDPEIAQNITRWKLHVNPELNRMFAEVKRADPGSLLEERGRYFGARINLLAKGEEGQWSGAEVPEDIPVPGTGSRANANRNPDAKRDRFDRAAKFTGDYSTSAPEVLANVLGPRWNEVTKLRLYDKLVKNGDAVEVQPGGQRPTELKGKPAKWMTIKVPQTDPATGQTSMVERGLVVRGDLAGELKNVLDTDQRLPTNPVFKVLTGLQLAQISDAVTHAKNIHTVIANAQGAKEAWKDAVRKLPVIGGTADFVGRLYNVTREVMSDSPAIRAEKAAMAKQGLLRPHHAASGITKLTGTHEALYAADTGARIIMNRFFDNLVERGLAKDSIENRRKFVQQVGEYNRRLMGPAMKSARDLGLSPFIVAGRNFNRMGRRIISGATGFEAASGRSAAITRGMQLAGVGLMATVPMMLNAITTGKPLGRPGTPVGAWDTGKDNEDGTHKVWDILQMTGARRGLRSIGADAVLQGLRDGKDINTIAGNAINDIVNSASHPWIGPGAGFAVAATTGRRLDMRGTMDAHQIKEGGGKQNLENVRAALESQNPFLYSLARPMFEHAGLDSGPGDKGHFKDVLTTLLKSPYQAAGVKDVKPGTDAAEDLAQRLVSRRFGEGKPPAETADNLAANRVIVEKLRRDPEGGMQLMDDRIAAGKLTPKQATLLSKKAGMSSLQWNVRQLAADDSALVYKSATDDEKKTLHDQVRDKIANSDFAPEQQDKMLKDAGIEPPAELQFKREFQSLNRKAGERSDAMKARDFSKAREAMTVSEASRLQRIRPIEEEVSRTRKLQKEGKITHDQADQKIRRLVERVAATQGD